MDIQVINHGSLIGFTPMSDDGEAWLADNLPDDVATLGTMRFAEPRYAGAIVDGMINDGIEVC